MGHNRIGISANSKNIPLSVRRNRAKRLLRESYRLTEAQLKEGHDILLITKKDVSRLSLDTIKDEVGGLYKKAGVLE